ncbi:MAG: hypothetical protein M3Z09_15670 [Acidobacteriota bacterium]|nr:hypothetical protein [Acidobacteriota bacterium]
MMTLLLWLLLFLFSWPLALVALVLYPVIWLLLLPFRMIGLAVGGVLGLVWSVLTLPIRLIAPANQNNRQASSSRLNRN